MWSDVNETEATALCSLYGSLYSSIHRHKSLDWRTTFTVVIIYIISFLFFMLFRDSCADCFGLSRIIANSLAKKQKEFYGPEGIWSGFVSIASRIDIECNESRTEYDDWARRWSISAKKTESLLLMCGIKILNWWWANKTCDCSIQPSWNTTSFVSAILVTANANKKSIFVRQANYEKKSVWLVFVNRELFDDAVLFNPWSCSRLRCHKIPQKSFVWSGEKKMQLHFWIVDSELIRFERIT